MREFWVSLIGSMTTFYTQYNQFNRPLTLWDSKIIQCCEHEDIPNFLKSSQHFIVMFSLDVMRTTNSYTCNILHTNIKRFDKLWNEIDNQCYVDNIMIKTIETLFMIYTLLLKKCKEDPEHILKIRQTFSQVELFIFYNDYELLVEYAVNYNTPSILDKLMTIIDINKSIKSLYNIDIKDKLEGKKLLKKLKNCTYN
jgi:hypothetical protein